MSGTPEGDDSFFYTQPGEELTYWRLIQNEYPYDRIAAKHYLLVSRRRFKNDFEMDADERAELLEFKKRLEQSQEFDFIGESISHRRTVPEHYHIHLIKFLPCVQYTKKLDK